MAISSHYSSNTSQASIERDFCRELNEKNERRQLDDGDLAGLKVSITDPQNRGEKIHAAGVHLIKVYQDHGCVPDEFGMQLLNAAHSKLKTAFSDYDLALSQEPLLSLTIVKSRLSDDVGQFNQHLQNYLSGGPRSELYQATEELKNMNLRENHDLKLAYITCLALCKLNNYQ